MCCFYHTSNTINLVTATKYTAFGVIEYCVFVKDLIDSSATTHGVIFAKYVAQITKQQGRYVGHRVLRFRSSAARHPTVSHYLESMHLSHRRIAFIHGSHRETAVVALRCPDAGSPTKPLFINNLEYQRFPGLPERVLVSYPCMFPAQTPGEH